MKKAYFCRTFRPIAKEILSPHFHIDENLDNHNLSFEKLCNIVREYDAVLSTVSDPFTREVLKHSENLKVISNLGIGLDNIDVKTAKERKIAVCNLLDVVTDSTADLMVAIFLSLIRKIPQAVEYVKEDRWKGFDPEIFNGEELRGKTCAIIGYGRTGKAVAKRLVGFGVKILAYGRRPDIVEDDLGGMVVQADMETVCERADYISIQVPLTPETKGMFDLDLMRKMKKAPILINVGRGPIVVTDDLVIALQEGSIRAAALDVTDPEPFPGGHPLCQFENCLIVPHIGSATVECRTEMAKGAAENIMKNISI